MNEAVTSLLERARAFLAEGDFAKADEYAALVLDIEPTNWEAYYLQFLSAIRLKNEAMLSEVRFSFGQVPVYQKLMAYAPDEVKAKLHAIDWANYESFLSERYREATETERLARSAALYIKAAGIYEELGDYLNARERAAFCRGEGRRLQARRKKRLTLWIVLAALATLLSFSPIVAILMLADDTPDVTTEAYRYTSVDGGVMILSPEDSTITEAIIPSRINGRKVVAIADEAFARCKNLTEVTIPSTVKRVGN